MTSAYSSLNVLQEFNPQPQLLNALVYHQSHQLMTRVLGKQDKEGSGNGDEGGGQG